MMDKNKVLGKALYFEFRKEQYTIQLVLTPESVNENGEYVPIKLMRRQISSYHPRKTWRFDNAGSGATNEHKERVLQFDNSFKQMETADAKYVGKMALQFVKPLLSQLHHQGWVLDKTPFAVEFAQEDATKISESATPQGLVRRILRTREALGYPTDLFKTSAE
jgi:hypothetical protein